MADSISQSIPSSPSSSVNGVTYNVIWSPTVSSASLAPGCALNLIKPGKPNPPSFFLAPVVRGAYEVDLAGEWIRFFGHDNPRLKMWKKSNSAQHEETMVYEQENHGTFYTLPTDQFKVLSGDGQYPLCECAQTKARFYCNNHCLYVDWCWFCKRYGCCRQVGDAKASFNAIVNRYRIEPEPLIHPYAAIVLKDRMDLTNVLYD